MWIVALIALTACTSARKASNAVVVTDPRRRGTDSVRSEQPPSLLRQAAAKLKPNENCSQALQKRVRSLAPRRWPRAGCPAAFSELVRVIDEKGDYSNRDRAVLNSLRRIDCQGQGLISNVDGADSLADGVQALLAREAPTASGRQTASDQPVTVHEHLQKILAVNVPLEKLITAHGDYILSEDNLQVVVGIVNDGCRLKTVQHFFSRDNAMLKAMTANEGLIVDPKVKKEYGELRLALEKVFDQNIRSFF